MAKNKVVFGNQTLIDLTEDTVSSDKMLSGTIAHDKSGEQIIGGIGIVSLDREVTPHVSGITNNTITQNGTYSLEVEGTGSEDIDRYVTDETITGNVASIIVDVPSAEPALQSKTVSPTTSQQTVTPDSGYDGLSQVTVNKINLQSKTVSPTTSQQTITPDSSYHGLSQVTVDAENLQTKITTVTPTANWSGTITEAVGVTPDSGYDGMSQVNVSTPMIRDNTLLTASTVSTPNTVYNGDTSQSNSDKLLRLAPTKTGMAYTGSFLYMKPNSYLGNASAEDVVAGKTFSSENGIQVTGTASASKESPRFKYHGKKVKEILYTKNIDANIEKFVTAEDITYDGLSPDRTTTYNAGDVDYLFRFPVYAERDGNEYVTFRLLGWKIDVTVRGKVLKFDLLTSSGTLVTASENMTLTTVKDSNPYLAVVPLDVRNAMIVYWYSTNDTTAAWSVTKVRFCTYYKSSSKEDVGYISSAINIGSARTCRSAAAGTVWQDKLNFFNLDEDKCSQIGIVRYETSQVTTASAISKIPRTISYNNIHRRNATTWALRSTSWTALASAINIYASNVYGYADGITYDRMGVVYSTQTSSSNSAMSILNHYKGDWVGEGKSQTLGSSMNLEEFYTYYVLDTAHYFNLDVSDLTPKNHNDNENYRHLLCNLVRENTCMFICFKDISYEFGFSASKLTLNYDYACLNRAIYDRTFEDCYVIDNAEVTFDTPSLSDILYDRYLKHITPDLNSSHIFIYTTRKDKSFIYDNIVFLRASIIAYANDSQLYRFSIYLCFNIVKYGNYTTTRNNSVGRPNYYLKYIGYTLYNTRDSVAAVDPSTLEDYFDDRKYEFDNLAGVLFTFEDEE